MKEIDLKLNLRIRATQGWMYEHAFSCNWIAEIRPEYEDVGEDSDSTYNLVNRLHRECAETVGTQPDNKQTFKCHILGTDQTVLYLTFHDGNLYIGTDVRPYRGNKLSSPDYPKQQPAPSLA